MIPKRRVKGRCIHCQTPIYLEKFGKPTNLQQLKQHNCLYYSYFRAGLEWSFDGPNGTERFKPEGNIQVNNSDVLKHLMLDDVGICQMPLFIVEQELANGQLIEILHEYRLPLHGIYALYPQREFVPAKLKVFLDFLNEHLSQKVDAW